MRTSFKNYFCQNNLTSYTHKKQNITFLQQKKQLILNILHVFHKFVCIFPKENSKVKCGHLKMLCWFAHSDKANITNLKSHDRVYYIDI